MSDYRETHQTAAQVEHYDRRVYDPGTWDSWVWAKEQLLLRRLLDRFGGPPLRHLDFACGTGRLLAFVEDFAAESTGVDVSEAMLEVARGRAPGARLVCGDLTRRPQLLEGRFGLITVFRFFQNAQPELRIEALRVLRRLLDDDGTLICNIHNNTWSLSLPSTVLRRIRGRPINSLSVRQLHRYVSNAGMELSDVHAGTYTTRTLFRVLGPALCGAIDRLLVALRVPPRLAVNAILVCRTRAP